MRASGIICIGFCVGFATASVWLVALGYGAGVDERVECTLAAVQALPEGATLATARGCTALVACVQACAAVLPGETPSE